MDCAKKTLMFLALCALVGAGKSELVQNNLEILISVPSSHIGETEILTGSTAISSSIRCTIVVAKNQTTCINSTDPSCINSIMEPSVDFSANDGKNFTYFMNINRAYQFDINVAAKVGVTPRLITSGGGDSDRFTVVLNIMYNSATTTMGSLNSGKVSPTLFRFRALFRTTVSDTNTGNNNGQGNGQSTLSSGPMIALIVLALLPVLLLKVHE
ncbi:uncharacterized protein ACNLHF_000266 [Anomaloglossus baeobatrachus]|uniref:uncharacterized protein LOC142250353 n=1 Tax=Anomaloglossus baeobatrachus TaxID=238106 RepID=UPI003F4FB6FB